MKDKPLDVQFAEKLTAIGRSKNTVRGYVGRYHEYMHWINSRRGRFIHPRELGIKDLEEWLTYLANDLSAAPSSINGAMYAIVALYRDLLRIPLEGHKKLRAKVGHSVKTPVDQDQIPILFAKMRGKYLLMAQLMYATGMRISEVTSLRLKDLHFGPRQILVRDGKGEKDRVVQFPALLHEPVRRQVESAKGVWKDDMRSGRNGVGLPYAFHRKSPSAAKELGWYFLFPSDSECRCENSNRLVRWHVHEDTVRKQVKSAARRAEILQRVHPHLLRHSFATHSLEHGMPIHVLQKLMGHNDIRTTELYLHLCKDSISSAKSPIDFLADVIEEKSSGLELEKPKTEGMLASELERPSRHSVSGVPRLRIVG